MGKNCNKDPDQFEILDVSKIQTIPSDTEIPVHDFPVQTERPLCTNFPENAKIIDNIENIVKIITDISEDLNESTETCIEHIPNYIEGLQSIYDPNSPIECNSDLFKDEQYTIVSNIDELKKLLSELLIRFDTSPKNYTKSDYQVLLKILYSTLLYLYKPENQLSWLEEEPPEKHRVSFMKVSGTISAFETAINKYPSAVIFYQGQELNNTIYKIYANGYTYNIPTREDFLQLKHDITILNSDENTEGSVLYNIKQALSEYLIKNIDRTPSNGVYLTLNNGTLGIHLDLVTHENNGAMASQDKIKLDELEWVTIN